MTTICRTKLPFLALPQLSSILGQISTGQDPNALGKKPQKVLGLAPMAL
jgi:hypothetical protein